jgi:uncharacterized protein (TIGR00251 family)
MAKLNIREVEGGVVFSVKVVPAGSKTAISGLLNGMIKVKVSAAPEKGKANQRLIEFLAKQLGVKKSSIRIIAGQTNPIKKIQVLGLSEETVVAKLIPVV